MLVRVVSSLLLAEVIATAAMLTATVTASGPVKIGAHKIPASAASEFPVSLADKVSTLDGPAVIRIGEKAVLKLEPFSVLQPEIIGDNIVVRLLDGTLHYELASDANVQVYALELPAKPRLVGTVKVDGKRRKALFLLGSGGAGSLITTLGLTTRSASCPPAAEGCGH